MKTVEQMLERYDEVTRNVDEMERALWHLLKANESNIKDWFELDLSGYRLHKALRQNDVCDDGYTDMAIWNLMHSCKLYWKVLEEKDNDEF